jgi:hypothetical protein
MKYQHPSYPNLSRGSVELFYACRLDLFRCSISVEHAGLQNVTCFFNMRYLESKGAVVLFG